MEREITMDLLQGHLKFVKIHRPLSPFLFIKNKRLFISSEGFPTLEKNALICYQRAMLPIHAVGCDRPLQIVMAVWRPFCWNSNLLGRV